MQPRAWFRCIKGCPGELPLTDIVYECPRCGDRVTVRIMTTARPVDPIVARVYVGGVEVDMDS